MVISNDRGQSWESVHMKAAYCVHYEESFRAGDVGHGAYTCYFRLSDPGGYEIVKGGPPASSFIRPAPGTHGSPHTALIGVAPGLLEPVAGTVTEWAPLVLPDLITTAVPFVAPVLTGLAAIAGVLALILATTTPAHAPGLPPTDPNELRLRYLAAKHAAGTLTADEEAELIELLAKVKGVRVHKLADLDPARKPKYAPVVGKWVAKGGRVDTLANGDFKYTDWDGNTVVYHKGFPIFDPHARQQVDIPNMVGDCSKDFKEADKLAPLGPKLDENTWHHHENLRTMQEVPYETHKRFTHHGARAVFNQNKKASNKPVIKKKKP